MFSRKLKLTIYALLAALVVVAALLSLLDTNSSSPQATPAAGPDAAVVRQLEQAGSDITATHEIEFFLYFPSVDAAERGAAALANRGFSTEVRQGADGNATLCLAKKRMVPDVDELTRLRVELGEIAANLGGEYDGWGAPVVR